MNHCTLLIRLFFLASFFPVSMIAQQAVPAVHNHEHEESHYGDSLAGFNPDAVMAVADSKGLNPLEAAMFLARAQRDYIDQRYQLRPAAATVVPRTSSAYRLAPLVGNNAPAQTPCTNMDFEMGGFFGWTGSIGDNNLSSAGPLQNIQAGFFSTVVDALATDCNARHTIMTAASGNDPCGPMPTVAPGGNFSVRLGNTCASYQGEIIEQTFTVSNINTSFTYQYAVVLNDGGHLAGEQPYFSIEMYDQNGNVIPCSQYYVEASGTIPGFTQCSPTIFYKPWTTVNVDLLAYVGQNVTIRFTAAGCIYGGHYGYAYIDASCLQYSITQSDSLCAGSSVTLAAPIGAQSYLWQPTGQTTQTITVNTAGSYTVTMNSVTNCTTQLTAVVSLYPQPIPAFTPTFPPCSNVYTFQNNSTISAGSMTYHWDFGEPTTLADTSNLTSPTYTYTTAGTFTVTLIVTSQNGCSDTIQQVVNPGNAGLANFSAPGVCLNNMTIFTDQSAPSTGWSWNFGEPSSGPADSSNLQNPTHTYSSPGSYTVTLTAQTSPCPSVMTQVITVNPLPVAQFTYTQVCGGQVVNFQNTSTILPTDTISTVSWNFGDPGSGPANISNLNNPQHVFSGPGTFTVIVTVTSTDNCQTTASQQIVVGPSPVSAFTATNVCSNTPMSFTNNSQNTTQYFWDFGVLTSTTDTTSSTTPAYTYTTAGTYTVTLIAAPGSPCSDTSTLAVTVQPGPLVQFLSPAVCFGQAITFTDQSSIASGNISTWHWDFGVSTTQADTANTTNASYNYAAAGVYTVSLTATSNNGCVTTGTQQVTVNALPVASFTAAPVCANTPMSFTDLSISTSGNIVGWAWDFGDGSPILTGQGNPTHTYTSANTWQVTLVVVTSFGCIDTVIAPVITAAPPTPLFVGDRLSGCAPLCVNFTDQSTISAGNVTGWTWNFGDGSLPVFTQNPTHCYNVPGTYDVTLIASSGAGCSTMVTIPGYITVYPDPIAIGTATPPITTVVNTDVAFADQSIGAITWSWNFGDPSVLSDTANTPTANYTYPNDVGSTYYATLTVTNQYGCVDDTVLRILVEPEFTFFIPNAFTPNGDGKNETFFGQGIGIAKYEMWIFDRWGNLIFTATDINQGWDGVVQGKGPELCQQDVYVWRVRIVDVFNKKHDYIGHVSLIR